MKYIRTKNRIVETKKYGTVNENGTLLVVSMSKEFIERTRGMSWNNGENIVIKQADTIEELCDCFVYSDEVFKNVIYNNFHALKILLKLRKNYVVYGAVWCDKGLIFVACMNNKGVFELL